MRGKESSWKVLSEIELLPGNRFFLHPYLTTRFANSKPQNFSIDVFEFQESLEN